MSWACDFDFGDAVTGTNHAGNVKNQPYQHQSYSAPLTGSSDGVHIADLSQGFINTKTVGIVIAKEEPRHFKSKKDPNSERCLLSFTIRDTPSDFINVTCWGSEDYINTTSQQFHMGDVVEISNMSVQYKPTDGSDEKYRPSTPSAYTMNLGEKKVVLKVVTEWYLTDYSHLLHIPTKPQNDYYTIADIVANGQNLTGEYINILTVVKQVGPAKEMTTKLGKQMTRCEVKLFDETAPNLDLMIWDKELVSIAENWAPRDHVLFAADVRVSYNTYRKSMVVSATSKTIITVNPDTKEAHQLYQYAQTADIIEPESMDVSTDGGHVNLSSIVDVYHVDEMTSLQAVTGDIAPVYGIIYATITTLDMDSDNINIIAVRCTKCRYRVDSISGVCTNQNCAQGNMMELNGQHTDTDTVYDLRMAISDHTGTLSGCRVNDDVVTTMTNCTPQEFMYLPDEDKTRIKWQFLLERCKIHFKLMPATFERPMSTVRVLSCEKADLNQVVQ